jgi:dihydrofolate reductase
MGKIIVMGSKTYETIGRPLSGRTNVVLTRSKKYKDYNVITYSDFDKLMNGFTYEADIMIIGGAEIYKLGLQYAERLYVTHIAAEYTGDVYFPEINWAQYRIISEKKSKELTFRVYEKRRD